jgi:hypothetical protein
MAVKNYRSYSSSIYTTMLKNVSVDHANKKRVGAVLHRYTVEIFTRAFSLKEIPVITPKVLRPILSNESRNFAPKVWQARFGAQRAPDFQ